MSTQSPEPSTPKNFKNWLNNISIRWVVGILVVVALGLSTVAVIYAVRGNDNDNENNDNENNSALEFYLSPPFWNEDVYETNFGQCVVDAYKDVLDIDITSKDTKVVRENTRGNLDNMIVSDGTKNVELTRALRKDLQAEVEDCYFEEMERSGFNQFRGFRRFRGIGI